MALQIPDHPWFPNVAMAADPELLGRLAEEHLEGDVPGFLFGVVPNQVFGAILTGETASLPIPSYLWLMHLSGYFGGVWLRREIARAQPAAPLIGVSVVPDETAFALLVGKLTAAVSAAGGSEADVLDHARNQIDAQADGYGYNRGYLSEILASPPAGLVPPPGFFDPGPLLGARYAGGEIDGLAELRDRFLAVGDRWPELRARLSGIETEADARGRGVWSTGLSVQGFPQAEYLQLLDLSASFLQAAQAAVLGSVLAVQEADIPLGRRAALVTAALAPWSASYMMGLLDGRGDLELPALT